MEDNFYKRLEILRETVKLSPVGYALVLKARKKGDSFEADQLEYFMRLRKYAYIIKPMWDEFTKIEHDSFGLLEFSEMVLDNYIEKRESKIRKK